MRQFIVEADGGSRGNPGPAGYGALVREHGTVLVECSESIGRATNNVAEYRGLIAGLQAALEIDPSAAVEVRMDSKLVVEQMSGRWKIKHADMRPLALQAQSLARKFPGVTYRWVPRERNKDADRLANEAMDQAALLEPGPGGADRSTAAGRSAAGAHPSTRAPAARTAAPGALGWRAPTSSPTRFLLLRHGQTPLSVERRFSGVGDPSLTPVGEQQAAASAQRLRSYGGGDTRGISVIVSSPLRRARQTAQAVATALGLPLFVDDGLREVDFGAWEGLSFAEIAQRWPDDMRAWLDDPDVPPPGGESFARAQQRVGAARSRILADHPDQVVLAVSHVTPIKLLVQLALEAPIGALYRLHLDLASLTTVDYFADGPAVLRGFNDTAHLTAR